MKDVTISDIANLAQVSPATVSRVLHNRDCVRADTRKKIIAAMEETGYKYRLGEETNPYESKLILLNIPSLDNAIYNDVAKGIKESADNHGYRMIINTEDSIDVNREHVVSLISSIRPAGMIVLNPADAETMNRFNQILPTVQCLESTVDSDVSYVSIDDYQAAVIAVEHIISTGHEKIAFLNSPLKNKYAQDRQRGFLEALAKHRITPVQDWVIQIPRIDFRTAYSVSTQLLRSSNRPDAIFTSADLYAVAAIRAAQSINIKIPEDLVIVGFDNLIYSEMTNPPLTTVSQPAFQQGFTAAQLLFDIIRTGSKTKQVIELPTELIVRQSTVSFF